MSKYPTQETIIKHQVKDYLRLNGWFVYHNLAGLGVYPGIPDLTAIKNGKVLFIECKTSSGRLSHHQQKFQEEIKAHGGTYLIVTGIEHLESYILEF